MVCHDDDRKKDYRERVFEFSLSLCIHFAGKSREFGGFEKRFKRWYSRLRNVYDMIFKEYESNCEFRCSAPSQMNFGRSISQNDCNIGFSYLYLTSAILFHVEMSANMAR